MAITLVYDLNNVKFDSTQLAGATEARLSEEWMMLESVADGALVAPGADRNLYIPSIALATEGVADLVTTSTANILGKLGTRGNISFQGRIGGGDSPASYAASTSYQKITCNKQVLTSVSLSMTNGSYGSVGLGFNVRADSTDDATTDLVVKATGDALSIPNSNPRAFRIVKATFDPDGSAADTTIYGVSAFNWACQGSVMQFYSDGDFSYTSCDIPRWNLSGSLAFLDCTSSQVQAANDADLASWLLQSNEGTLCLWFRREGWHEIDSPSYSTSVYIKATLKNVKFTVRETPRNAGYASHQLGFTQVGKYGANLFDVWKSSGSYNLIDFTEASALT